MDDETETLRRRVAELERERDRLSTLLTGARSFADEMRDAWHAAKRERDEARDGRERMARQAGSYLAERVAAEREVERLRAEVAAAEESGRRAGLEAVSTELQAEADRLREKAIANKSHPVFGPSGLAEREWKRAAEWEDAALLVRLRALSPAEPAEPAAPRSAAAPFHRIGDAWELPGLHDAIELRDVPVQREVREVRYVPLDPRGSSISIELRFDDGWASVTKLLDDGWRAVEREPAAPRPIAVGERVRVVQCCKSPTCGVYTGREGECIDVDATCRHGLPYLVRAGDSDIWVAAVERVEAAPEEPRHWQRGGCPLGPSKCVRCAEEVLHGE